MEKYFAKSIDGKLMLASRDIAVGDKITSIRTGESYRVDGDEPNCYHTFNPTGGWKCDMEEKGKEISSVGRLYTSIAKVDSFKVIGEILTQGIKEGQEFTEKEIEYLTIR